MYCTSSFIAHKRVLIKLNTVFLITAEGKHEDAKPCSDKTKVNGGDFDKVSNATKYPITCRDYKHMTKLNINNIRIPPPW